MANTSFEKKIVESELRALWALPPDQITVKEISRRLGVTMSGHWAARKRIGLGDRPPSPSWNKGCEKPIDVSLLFKLWHSDPESVSIDVIADRLGASATTIYKQAKRHKLPRRPRVVRVIQKSRDDEEFCPTPEEIQERAKYCRVMRAKGTPVGGVW